MFLADETATIQLGRAIGAAVPAGAVVFLRGDLGAGKTTLVRGVLSSFGHDGAVKSPTYTLVEPYVLEQRTIYHFDLYRLADPEELEYIGIRDYFDDHSILLIEWDVRGQGMLPEPDLIVNLMPNRDGRLVSIKALSVLGEAIKAHVEERLT